MVGLKKTNQCNSEITVKKWKRIKPKTTLRKKAALKFVNCLFVSTRDRNKNRRNCSEVTKEGKIDSS